MDLEWMGFLESVRAFVAKHPGSAPHVATFAQAGLQEALNKAHERAADMEVALVVATSPGYKKGKANEIIADKLRKWQGQTSCRWEWLTDNQ